MTGPKRSGRAAAVAPVRKHDPDRARRDILDVARAEFVEKGLAGSRVDEIAARTKTSKRMIYYYFGDKQGLYRAVLEEAYSRIRRFERELCLDGLTPPEALRALTGFTFDHHADNPDFVRLVSIENIHQAEHLKASPTASEQNLSAMNIVAALYERGVASGDFRPGLDSRDIHLTMSALAFYNVSNRHTILQLFGHDMMAPPVRAARRAAAVEAMLRWVLKTPDQAAVQALTAPDSAARSTLAPQTSTPTRSPLPGA